MFALLAVDFAATSETTAYKWAEMIANLYLNMFISDLENASIEMKRGIISKTLNVTVVIVTLFGLITAFLAYRKNLKDIKNSIVVEEYPVKDVGKDDLQTMYEYYKKGTSITVFSGDFDWILKHSDLRKLISRLSREDKIILVSYKRERDIKRSWENTARDLGMTDRECQDALNEIQSRFRFHEKKLKFTFIEIGNQYSFLSLVQDNRPGSKGVNIGVHSSKNPRALDLLQIVRGLSDPEGCRDLRTWDNNNLN